VVRKVNAICGHCARHYLCSMVTCWAHDKYEPCGSIYEFVTLTFDLLYSKMYNEEREYIQQTIMTTNEFVLASYFNPRNLYAVRRNIIVMQ